MAVGLIATLLSVQELPNREGRRTLRQVVGALKDSRVATNALVALTYSYAFFTVLAYSPLTLEGAHNNPARGHILPMGGARRSLINTLRPTRRAEVYTYKRTQRHPNSAPHSIVYPWTTCLRSPLGIFRRLRRIFPRRATLF
jgi:hypothetical protein